jgi:PilZ domain
MSTPTLRILVIEPETSCAEQLRAMLADRVFAQVVIAPNADDACAVLRRECPDLILLSAVFPPRDEEQVVTLLKWLDPYGRVPVLTIPPATKGFEEENGSAAPRGLLARLTRRPIAPQVYYYDPGMLVCRIGEALREARKAKNVPQRLALPPKPESDTALIPVSADSIESQSTDLTVVAQANHTALRLQRQRVERARRLHAAELPHRVTVMTRAGLVVRTVNVSNSGILFESPLKFTPETETALTVFGEQAKFDLSVRIVRSEAAAVNGLGVTYHTAVAFSEERELLTMLGAIPAEVTSPRQSVPDLLVQVTTELYEKGNYDGARSAFDGFLHQIAPRCKVRLAESLSEPPDGCDSIYFNVPAPTRAILEATFDQGHEPSIEEFKVLRASAAIASVLLQYESRLVLAQPA